MDYDKLYHCTHLKHKEAILKHGLVPNLSRKQKARTWFISRQRLNYIIDHISKRDNVPLDKLIVIEITPSEAMNLKRHASPAMYHTKAILNVLPEQVKPALHYFKIDSTTPTTPTPEDEEWT